MIIKRFFLTKKQDIYLFLTLYWLTLPVAVLK